jgi:hypothetical protein
MVVHEDTDWLEVCKSLNELPSNGFNQILRFRGKRRA